MDVLDQKQGILIGIGLTLLGLYVFGFFTSSPNPVEEDKIQAENTSFKDLDMPIAVNTKARERKRTETKKEDLQKGQEWGTLKKMMKDLPVAVSAKVSPNHNVKAEEKEEEKEEEDKEEDEEKNAEATDENPQGTIVAQHVPESNPELAKSEDTVMAFGTAPVFPQARQKQNPALESVDQWINFLLSPPSWDKMEGFISAYKSQEVLESVFYSVIEALLENANSQVRHYGFLVLSSVTDFKSFEILVRIASNNDSFGNQDKARQTLESSYIGVHHLPILNQALESHEDNMKLKAISVAEISANKNLKNQNRSLVTNNEGGRVQRRPIDGRPSTPPPSASQAYRSLAEKLNQIASTDNNPDVQSSADRVARTIDNLLLGMGMVSSSY